MRELTQRCESEDEKFRTLQQAASVQTAAELEQYWASVQVSRAHLEGAVTAAQKKIERLNDARKSAEEELQTLRHTEEKFDPSRLAELEAKWKESSRRLQAVSTAQNQYREIVATAISVFTRIRRRISEDSEDLSEAALTSAISDCAAILEEIMANRLLAATPRSEVSKESDNGEIPIARSRSKARMSKAPDSHRPSRLSPPRRSTVKYKPQFET